MYKYTYRVTKDILGQIVYIIYEEDSDHVVANIYDEKLMLELFNKIIKEKQ